MYAWQPRPLVLQKRAINKYFFFVKNLFFVKNKHTPHSFLAAQTTCSWKFAASTERRWASLYVLCRCAHTPCLCPECLPCFVFCSKTQSYFLNNFFLNKQWCAHTPFLFPECPRCCVFCSKTQILFFNLKKYEGFSTRCNVAHYVFVSV